MIRYWIYLIKIKYILKIGFTCSFNFFLMWLLKILKLLMCLALSLSGQSIHPLLVILPIPSPSQHTFTSPHFPVSHSRRRWFPGQGLHQLDQCNNPPVLPGAAHIPRYPLVGGCQRSCELCCRRVAGAGRHFGSIQPSGFAYIPNLPFGTCPEEEEKKALLACTLAILTLWTCYDFQIDLSQIITAKEWHVDISTEVQPRMFEDSTIVAVYSGILVCRGVKKGLNYSCQVLGNCDDIPSQTDA